jgi:competence protein ComEA
MAYSKFSPLYIHSTAFRRMLLLLLVMGLSSVGMGTVAFAQDKAASAQQSIININSADAQSIAAGLKGIGASRAEAIVRYRETYGPFASLEELAEVKGVGKSTVDKNKNAITLE